MMALRRVLWLMMSGASITAVNSLSRGGSVVTAAGAFCARVAVEARARSSDAVAMSRLGLVRFMARHSGGFCELMHRKSLQHSERASVLHAMSGYRTNRVVAPCELSCGRLPSRAQV